MQISAEKYFLAKFPICFYFNNKYVQQTNLAIEAYIVKTI